MPPKVLADVPGWFEHLDQRLFEHFLSAKAVAPHGDLVEIGAYLGKSAILMGQSLHEGETFTVNDLFGGVAEDSENARENDTSYAGLTRQRFEENYLAFHDELPVVVEEPSSGILAHVAAGSARFVHVDGSHLYEHVAQDVLAAREMATPGAVIAFDDYRSAHTPGVSFALWEAVVRHGLHVLVLSPQKLYGTFDADPTPHHAALAEWTAAQAGEVESESVSLGAETALRIWGRKAADASGAALADPQLAVLQGQLARANEQLRILGEILRPMQERVRNIDDRSKASTERVRHLDERTRGEAERSKAITGRLDALQRQLGETSGLVSKVHRGQLARVLDLLEEIKAEQAGAAVRAYRKIRHR